MKYHARHVLKGTLEEVLEIVMDRSRDPRVYPNITSLRETRRHETDDELTCEYLVCGDGEIPAPLRLIANHNMFTWREHGCWDKKRNIYTYHLKPFYFKHLVHAHGAIKFTPMDGETVLREIDAEMRIDIPLLGGLAAKTIAGYQLDNYRREEKLFHKYLEEHRKKKGAGDRV